MFHLFLNKERHVNKSIANRLYTIALINQQIKTKTFYEIEFFVTLHPKACLPALSGMHGFNVSAALGAIGSPALRYGQHKMTNRDGGESFTFHDATHNCLLSNVLWQHAGIALIIFFIRWTLRPTT